MDVSIREATSTPFTGPRGVDEVGGASCCRDGPRHVISPLSGRDNSHAAEFITLRSAAGDG